MTGLIEHSQVVITNNYNALQITMPVTVAERSKACTVFARSEAEIVSSNPTKAWMFGVCRRLFCVCVILCLGRDLVTS
jgi:hypothetical protein